MVGETTLSRGSDCDADRIRQRASDKGSDQHQPDIYVNGGILNKVLMSLPVRKKRKLSRLLCVGSSGWS
eukprot:scaffold12239_cov75-Skeletonema_dohrnii-CCMP3373.AAC.1